MASTPVVAEVPVAPGALPVFGHVLALLRDRVAFMQRLRCHADVVRIHVGPYAFHVINAPELLYHLLVVAHRDFDKGVFFDRTRSFLGDGLGCSSGDFHRRQRRLIQPAFHHAQIDAYVATMADQAAACVEAWLPGQPIPLYEELADIALQIIASVAISAPAGLTAVQEFRRGIPILTTGVGNRALLPTFLAKIPTRSNRQFAAAARNVHSAALAAVNAYRNADHPSDSRYIDGRAAHGTDVTHMLIDALDETGQGMTDQQVADEIITLLLAGSETVASTLAWLYHELASHPHLYAQLRTEITALLGQGHTARQITAADIQNLPHTTALIQETLRLHHPAWLLTRRATRPTSLPGLDLPAGTELMFSPRALHRDPAIYPRPLAFDPDRWNPHDKQSKQPPRGAFIPFGAGPHQCIGDRFAWAQMTVLIATITTRWHLQPTQPLPPASPCPVPGITVFPKLFTVTPSAI